MENKRIEYLDAIKGFTIFLMVMGHAIAWNYADFNEICIYKFNQPINVKTGQLIYSFHIPLFFMISGFLLYKTYYWKDFVSFFKKKVSRLLLYYLFFSIKLFLSVLSCGESYLENRKMKRGLLILTHKQNLYVS